MIKSIIPLEFLQNLDFWLQKMLWVIIICKVSMISWETTSAEKSVDYFVFIIHYIVNTLRPRQNGRHLADNIFKCIFLNENFWIPNKISLKFVPKGPINNIPSLAQIMAWRRPGDKPLSEPMMVSSLTHISDTRPQWVKQTKTEHHLQECCKHTACLSHVPLFHLCLSVNKLVGSSTVYLNSMYCTFSFIPTLPSLTTHHIPHTHPQPHPSCYQLNGLGLPICSNFPNLCHWPSPSCNDLPYHYMPATWYR